MVKRNVSKILITGAPGSGKSTLIAKLIHDLDARRIAGLRTPEVRRSGIRVGFKMVDLATGAEELLASTSGTGPTVGKYHVNMPGIDQMVQTVEASLNGAEHIFIDEIGKMELLSTSFRQFVERVFSLDKPVIATLHRHLVAQYRNKGQLYLLTRDNFEQIRGAIQAELKTSDK